MDSSNLTALASSGNLTTIINSMTTLVQFRANGCGIKEFPVGIKRSDMQVISLGGNLLTVLPMPATLLLPGLTMLNVSSNNISTIVPIVNASTSILTMDLSYNALTQLVWPATAGALQFLSFDHNFITTLDVGLAAQLLLKNITLSNNRISHIAPMLVVYNQQEQIPTPVRSVWSVDTLDLSYNHLTEVGNTTLWFTPFLSYLSLNHNRITNIELGAFASLANLQVADLSYNNLTQFTGAMVFKLFASMTMFTILDLSGNQLTQLENGTFSSLKSVISINLANNQLTEILAPFSGLATLSFIGLANNPLSMSLTTLQNVIWGTQYQASNMMWATTYCNPGFRNRRVLQLFPFVLDLQGLFPNAILEPTLFALLSSFTGVILSSAEQPWTSGSCCGMEFMLQNPMAFQLTAAKCFMPNGTVVLAQSLANKRVICPCARLAAEGFGTINVTNDVWEMSLDADKCSIIGSTVLLHGACVALSSCPSGYRNFPVSNQAYSGICQYNVVVNVSNSVLPGDTNMVIDAENIWEIRCEPCGVSNCSACPNDVFQCTVCDGDTFLLNGACVASCPVNTLAWNGECMPCQQQSCQYCVGSVSNCDMCRYSMPLYQGSCLPACIYSPLDPSSFVNVSITAEGYTGLRCLNCADSRCFNCSTDVNNCSACIEPFFLNTLNGSCVATCPSSTETIVNGRICAAKTYAVIASSGGGVSGKVIAGAVIVSVVAVIAMLLGLRHYLTKRARMEHDVLRHKLLQTEKEGLCC